MIVQAGSGYALTWIEEIVAGQPELQVAALDGSGQLRTIPLSIAATAASWSSWSGIAWSGTQLGIMHATAGTDPDVHFVAVDCP